MNLPARRSNCALNVALELFGDKWSLLLLRDMLVLGKFRYGEFLESPEGISTNILASRLKQMESCGLVEKLPDPRDRKTSAYLPTELGVSLMPVVLAVMRWGSENLPNTGVLDFVETALQDDPADLIAKCQTRLHDERLALGADHGLQPSRR